MRAPIVLSMTYETVSQESAEHGDFEDTGFSMEPETVSFRDCIEHVKRNGIGEIETTYNGLRITHYPECDYHSGDETTETSHIACDSVTVKRIMKFLK